MDHNIMKEKIKEFFENNILYEESFEDINSDESLIDKGYIDSIGIISLVSYIEKSIKIGIPDNEIIPDNFDSINSIYAYLSKKLGAMEQERLGGVG